MSYPCPCPCPCPCFIGYRNWVCGRSASGENLIIWDKRVISEYEVVVGEFLVSSWFRI